MGNVYNCFWKTSGNFQVFDYWTEFDSTTQKHLDSVLNKSLTHMTETMQINANNSSQGKGSSKKPRRPGLYCENGGTPSRPSEQMSTTIRMSHVDKRVSMQTRFRLCQTHLVKGFVIALFISCLNWNVRSMHSTLSQEFPLFHRAATAGTFCWLTQPDLL